MCIIKGDSEKAFREADHVLEGEIRIGGQEHFYLETNVTIAVPREEDELEVFCSTQHPTEIQKLIAYVLNIHINRVNVRVKRLGGGFGGKESRPALLAIPVAFAAHRYVLKLCKNIHDFIHTLLHVIHAIIFEYKDTTKTFRRKLFYLKISKLKFSIIVFFKLILICFIYNRNI